MSITEITIRKSSAMGNSTIWVDPSHKIGSIQINDLDYPPPRYNQEEVESVSISGSIGAA